MDSMDMGYWSHTGVTGFATIPSASCLPSLYMVCSPLLEDDEMFWSVVIKVPKKNSLNHVKGVFLSTGYANNV